MEKEDYKRHKQRKTFFFKDESNEYSYMQKRRSLKRGKVEEVKESREQGLLREEVSEWGAGSKI